CSEQRHGLIENASFGKGDADHGNSAIEQKVILLASLRDRVQVEVASIRSMRVMKWNRSVGGAVEKLAHEWIVGNTHLRGGTRGGDYTVGNQVNIIDDLHGFGGIVRDDD